MGTYGFVRFSLPLFPEATMHFMPYLILLAVVGIVYGALTAMMQPDMKKLVAYSSVSHLGFVMLGVFALNQQGVEGGILQMINHGLSTGALFLLVGLIYERRHTRMIKDFGGLSKQMPIYAMLFMIITLSSIGLPGLNGFIGEFTILVGAFKALWMKDIVFNAPISTLMVLLATSGIVLGAAYMLWMYQRVMFGKLDNPDNENLKDLNLREITTLVPIIALCFWIGLYPKPFLEFMDEAVTHTVKIANPKAAMAEMIQMREQDAQAHGIESPHGVLRALPPGHPPVGAPRLPAGHAEMVEKLKGGSGMEEHAKPAAHGLDESKQADAHDPSDGGGH
jgi:NADH-quinone oxidoreductase subunit M